MDSSMTKYGINVTLAKADLWREFHPHTEMIVTRHQGRCLFPHLIYQVKGLDPKALYQVFISLRRIDSKKYKYENTGWQEFAKGEPILPIVEKEHKDGARLGEHWMKETIKFADLKITNDIEHKDKKLIVVQSMHKYVPVVAIKKVGDTQGIEFSFDLTQFFAVTAYQSPAIIKLKVEHNKFAKGFRSNGKRNTSGSEDSTPKRRSTSSSSTTSSTSTPQSLSPPAPCLTPWNNSFSPATFNQNSFPTPDPTPPFPVQFDMTGTAAGAAAPCQFYFPYYPGASMNWNNPNMNGNQNPFTGM